MWFWRDLSLLSPFILVPGSPYPSQFGTTCYDGSKLMVYSNASDLIKKVNFLVCQYQLMPGHLTTGSTHHYIWLKNNQCDCNIASLAITQLMHKLNHSFYAWSLDKIKFLWNMMYLNQIKQNKINWWLICLVSHNSPLRRIIMTGYGDNKSAYIIDLFDEISLQEILYIQAEIINTLIELTSCDTCMSDLMSRYPEVMEYTQSYFASTGANYWFHWLKNN